MKIATFNINGVRKRLANLLGWLDFARPDIVCLQEIKCTQAAFPRAELEAAGYGAIWRGQGPHHGVAILARGVQPMQTRARLPGDPLDLDARYLEAAVQGVLIGCLYLPNGNPRPGPKFDYKLAWFERLIAHAEALKRAQVPAVLAGDYNVVPTDADIYATRSWLSNALLQPEPRTAFARLLSAGWTDAVARYGGDAHAFTFWDYKRDAWSRNAGLRIDHLLVNDALASRLTAAGVDRDVRAQPDASDHAPAWLRLEESPGRNSRVR